MAAVVVLATAPSASAHHDHGSIIFGACVGSRAPMVMLGTYWLTSPHDMIAMTQTILNVPGGRRIGTLSGQTSHPVPGLRWGRVLRRAALQPPC